jgi:para-aminobenzoate synthetase/4-amino-4-deoxychorismate lyase
MSVPAPGPFPDNTVLLHEPTRRRWLLFENPVRVHLAHDLADVLPALHAVEKDVAQGRFAAGFVAYDAGPAFDPALRAHRDPSFPLVWFGIYEAPKAVSLPHPADLTPASPIWTPSISRAAYQAGFRRIKDHIAAGDTYQVNYTLRLRAPADFNPWELFLAMVRAQGAGYGAYCQLPNFVLASASPEMFFELVGEGLLSRPMKGTAPRGLTVAADRQLAAWLADSEKNRAENVMIVDMVRNDMGRIATIGSVSVPHLWTIEQYPTVWQMTSTVASETDASLGDIFRAMFPPASITGAPKARAMSIITEVEDTPRRVYTGSIGFVAPGRRAQFNVAIRTVLVDRRERLAEYGTGGGIVWDSEGQAEYDECLTKARILTEPMPDCALLETLAWTPEEGYFLLAEHLERLGESARYFGWSLAPDAVRQTLLAYADTLPAAPQRVRLVVPSTGQPHLSAQPLAPLPTPYRLGLARAPIRADNRYLYHKTTCRQPYEAALADRGDCDDVLLWNESGEITESCIANVIVALDGRLLTPPVSCGLLPGIFRAKLLAEGRIEEGIVHLDDLNRADGIYLVNSVRRQWPATLIVPAQPPHPVGYGA